MTRDQKIKLINFIFDVDPKEIKEYIHVDGSAKRIERFLDSAKEELISILETIPDLE